MKTGKSLQELAQEITRQSQAKRDFVVSADRLSVELAEAPSIPAKRVPRIVLRNGHSESFPITPHAHQQLVTRIEIPSAYAERLREEVPDLYTTSLNRLIQHKGGSHMIRTLDGDARAVMSNKYRRLDHFGLMQAVLPTVNELGEGLRVESAEVTERRLYIKLVWPRMEMEVKKGDPVQAGLVISNSEIGAGLLSVYPMIYRLVCTNGMIAADSGQRKYHIGRGVEGEMTELYSDKTLQADDRAFWLKVQDTVRGTLTDAQKFRAIVERMAEAAGDVIEKKPAEVIELAKETFELSDGEGDSVLQHLLTGGDLSRYGLLNAITRTAQDADSYDRATELETLGGSLLSIGEKDWKRLAA